MNNPTIALALAVAALGAATGPEAPATLEYDVTAVK
jgi:hypothetical protein